MKAIKFFKNETAWNQDGTHQIDDTGIALVYNTDTEVEFLNDDIYNRVFEIVSKTRNRNSTEINYNNTEILPLDKPPKEYTAQELINNEALSYLANTDWYVTRFIETGVMVPEAISLERQNARNRIIK